MWFLSGQKSTLPGVSGQALSLLPAGRWLEDNIRFIVKALGLMYSGVSAVAGLSRYHSGRPLNFVEAALTHCSPTEPRAGYARRLARALHP